jgi:hypothetical protein
MLILQISVTCLPLTIRSWSSLDPRVGPVGAILLARSLANLHILEVCPSIRLCRVLGSMQLGRFVTEGPFP